MNKIIPIIFGIVLFIITILLILFLSKKSKPLKTYSVYFLLQNQNAYSLSWSNNSILLTSFNLPTPNPITLLQTVLVSLDIPETIGIGKYGFQYQNNTYYPNNPTINSALTYSTTYTGWYFTLSPLLLDASPIYSYILSVSNGTQTVSLNINTGTSYFIAATTPTTSPAYFGCSLAKISPIDIQNGQQAQWYLPNELGIQYQPPSSTTPSILQ
jgi:hypothetical protein